MLNDRTRLIPIEDRRRKLIAARHSARVRRLFGTQVKLQAEPAVLPVFLTADEAIGLIAYGRSTALSSPTPGAPPLFAQLSSNLFSWSKDERNFPLARGMR